MLCALCCGLTSFCCYSNSVLFASNGFFKKHTFIPDLPADQQLGRVLFQDCNLFFTL